MGVYQPHATSTEAVCAEIKRIEHNSQHSTEGTLKQSIVQEVTNKSTLGSGEFKVPGAHKGPKS